MLRAAGEVGGAARGTLADAAEHSAAILGLCIRGSGRAFWLRMPLISAGSHLGLTIDRTQSWWFDGFGRVGSRSRRWPTATPAASMAAHRLFLGLRGYNSAIWPPS